MRSRPTTETFVRWLQPIIGLGCYAVVRNCYPDAESNTSAKTTYWIHFFFFFNLTVASACQLDTSSSCSPDVPHEADVPSGAFLDALVLFLKIAARLTQYVHMHVLAEGEWGWRFDWGEATWPHTHFADKQV